MDLINYGRNIYVCQEFAQITVFYLGAESPVTVGNLKT